MKNVEKKDTTVENSSTNTGSNTTQKVADSVKSTSAQVVDATKKFSDRDFGKFKGKHVLIVALVAVVLVVFCLFASSGSKGVAYPVVFSDDDGNLYLMGEKAKSKDNAIKLASDSSTSYVRYANTTDRYVLFIKNGDLYLYDAKKKDETTKILSEVSEFYFTNDDKYIVATDEDKNIYSYNFKGDKQKLDSDSEIIRISNTQVVYEKDDALYIRSLNAKKDDRQKITDDYITSNIRVSEDGKRVLYLNDDRDLYVYSVSKKDKEKIASEVSSYYCNEDCTKLYYVKNDEDHAIYYYDGKKDTKIVSSCESLLDVDVDSEIVLFSKKDDKTYTIFMQKGSKEAVKVEEDLKEATGYIYENGIYYESDGDFKYASITGSKIGKVSTVLTDVENAVEYNGGIAVISDVDKKSNGTLSFVSKGKAKKIDSDVYASSSALKVSEDGKNVYYIKDYSSTSGDLYVTNGGKGKKIDSDVYTFQVAKSNLLYYIKDYSSTNRKGDLYRFTGKSVKIAEDVRSIASIPAQFDANK